MTPAFFQIQISQKSLCHDTFQKKAKDQHRAVLTAAFCSTGCAPNSFAREHIFTKRLGPFGLWLGLESKQKCQDQLRGPQGYICEFQSVWCVACCLCCAVCVACCLCCDVCGCVACVVCPVLCVCMCVGRVCVVWCV